MESIQLQENLDGIKEEKERLLNSLVEAEYVFIIFISEKDSHFVVYEFYSCIMIHIYSMHFNCISGARSCYGRRKLSLPVKQGPLLTRKSVRVRSRPWTPRFTGCRSDTLSWWSSRRRWFRKWRKQCQGNIKSCLTMFWLTSSKHEQNDFQENATIYHYWYKWDTLQERHHCHKRRCPAEDK